jgi:hypothetical protein
VEYERDKFQGKLNDGTLTLQRTEAWILRSMRSVVAAGTIKLEDLVSGNKKAFVDLHTTSIASLIFAQQQDGPVTLGNAPETLLFDVTRINIWKAKFNDLVDGSTMLVKGVQHIIDRKLAPHQPERVIQELVIRDLANTIIGEYTKNGDTSSFKDTLTGALCQKLDDEQMMMSDGKREKMLTEISNSVGNSQNAVRALM